jgi:hypothetical protein
VSLVQWIAVEDRAYGERPGLDGHETAMRAALHCLSRGRVRMEPGADVLIPVECWERQPAVPNHDRMWLRIASEVVRVRASVDRIETFVPCPICGTGFRARDVPERMREALNERESDHA